MKKTLWSILWFCAAAVLAFFPLRWLTGDQFLPVRLINYFLPWVGVGFAVMVVIAALFRKAALAAVLLAALAAIGSVYAPLFQQCRGAASTEASLPKLRVMSYNIHKYNKEFSAIAHVIAAQRPDVVLLQEVMPWQIDPVFRELTRLLPNDNLNLKYDLKTDQAVISRFPVLETQASGRKNRAQKALIQAPFGDIRVINIHAYRDGWLDRHQRMERILNEDVLAERNPIILGGDFNTTDQSETFRAIEQYLKNAHLEAGCGFGFSFPAMASDFGNGIPVPAIVRTGLIRIDHIFFSSHFRAVRAYTVKDSGGSDHYPVVAELEVKAFSAADAAPDALNRN